MRKSECRKIYTEAFGADIEFDTLLFEKYFDYCHFFEFDGEVAAILFLLPCMIEIGDECYSAKYLYAVATAEKFKNRGIMTRFLEQICKQSNDIIFLKPAGKSLVTFYENRDFRELEATTDVKAKKRVVLGEAMRELALLCEPESNRFQIMVYNSCNKDLSGIYFVDTLY